MDMYWECMHVQMRAEELLMLQKLALFDIEENHIDNETMEANLEANNIDCPDEIGNAGNTDQDELSKELQSLSPIYSFKLHGIQQKLRDILRFLLQKG
jgi:hypothetical protein